MCVGNFEERLSLWPPASAESGSPKLHIDVIFTTTEYTPPALAAAAQLGRNLGARIRFLVIQVVPLQFPSLNHPPVALDFIEQRACKMAMACHADVEIRVRVYLCGDKLQCILRVLGPHSVVIVGGRRRWWRTEEQKLVSLLHSNGHRVILIDGRQCVESPIAESEPSESGIQGLRQF